MKQTLVKPQILQIKLHWLESLKLSLGISILLSLCIFIALPQRHAEDKAQGIVELKEHSVK